MVKGIDRFRTYFRDFIDQYLKLPIPIMGLLFENPIFEPRK